MQPAGFTLKVMYTLLKEGKEEEFSWDKESNQ